MLQDEIALDQCIEIDGDGLGQSRDAGEGRSRPWDTGPSP
jgi:hypothetical protein